MEKAERFFCNMLQQKDSIDSGETLRNKKTFFHLLSFIGLLHSLKMSFSQIPYKDCIVYSNHPLMKDSLI